MKKKVSAQPCPCGGVPAGGHFDACCRRYLDGLVASPDAERLMRSRYTAYATGNAAYVLATWHASTRPASLTLDPPGTPHATKWLALTIHRHECLDETHAQVEFTARYRDGGRAFKMTELSQFIKEDGHWLYVDGVVTP